ncbi:uncharacterized protein LOC129595144 [Paramacrobiotus metropolitanus]|uniref:uncharacterized protein LOC129595144 n=1 Tax=Paramacrobiotus metropolitanus TaxID=2943436 RepID=UPI002445B94F|nr:uncharacterized protein LOC129595144 [Paramacrobiotus metropolitanus]
MKSFVIFMAFIASSFSRQVKRDAGDQNPKVWDALAQNSGRGQLSAEDTLNLYINAKAGQDYPNFSEAPAGNFDCGSVKPGFYADVDYQCQVVRRCDINGNQTAYLCPNMTIFNQITLVCDWFYHVDCNQAPKWYDYSNSRLYQGGDVTLLDNQDQIGEEELMKGMLPSSKHKEEENTATTTTTTTTKEPVTKLPFTLPRPTFRAPSERA